MAYLHCHSCDWSQDDFWDWEWSGLKRFWKWRSRPFGYNPFSLMLEDIAEYWKPRIMIFDRCFAQELGFKSCRIFSWRFMIWQLRLHFERIFTQKWWTHKSFRKDYDAGKAVCPGCGKVDFDID